MKHPFDTVTLTEILPDDRNANRGTERGASMLEHSLRTYGAGRSILLDKHNRVIAGNKTVEQAAQIGLDDVVVVDSDGRKLVAVRRTDVDLDTPAGRELAIADNRTSEVGLEWDVNALAALQQEGVDLGTFWSDKASRRVRPARLALHVIVEDFPRPSAQILEGALMAIDKSGHLH